MMRSTLISDKFVRIKNQYYICPTLKRKRMFSKACEYGIRATLFIAQNSAANNRVSLKEISEKIDSPEAFTAKILQQLARNGIIISYKGPHGGFQIEKPKLETIHLNEIVDALDGDSIYNGCGLGLKECNAD